MSRFTAPLDTCVCHRKTKFPDVSDSISPQMKALAIQFYLLLSPYLCFISLLYLDLYVVGDDALIS